MIKTGATMFQPTDGKHWVVSGSPEKFKPDGKKLPWQKEQWKRERLIIDHVMAAPAGTTVMYSIFKINHLRAAPAATSFTWRSHQLLATGRKSDLFYESW